MRDIYATFNINSPRNMASIFIAVLLILVGASVLVIWHAPKIFANVYPGAAMVGYQSAIALIACGSGLMAVVLTNRLLLMSCSVVLFAIGALTLANLIAGAPLNTTNWLLMLFADSPIRGQSVSPATTLIILLAGVVLLTARYPHGNFTIITALVCVLIMFIALITAIGESLGIFPRFIWSEVKMAPQMAAGALAFAGTMFYLRQTAAVQAFNRLRFFNRLLTGTIFMSVLFVGVGSIGLLQINGVAATSQKLYEGPLQINNAVLRIGGYVSRLNRMIKDIAVNPELVNERNILQMLAQTSTNFLAETAIIQRDPAYQEYVTALVAEFTEWQILVAKIHNQLLAGDIESYRQAALKQSQDKAFALEALSTQTLQLAQQQMRDLNAEAITTKNHAADLMVIVITGFLMMGVLISGLITRTLSWQLQQIRNAMLEIAQNNTDVTIPLHDHPHEIGDMAKTLVVFARHVDERKKSAELIEDHQKKLEASNRQLALTNKELETFAYVASHDLKSPLRGIAQLSSWIDEDLTEKQFSEVSKHTQMLRNRILRMEKLLDDLLIFYRAGKTDGKTVSVDVAHMAKELFDIQNTKKGLRLQLGPHLPVFNTLSTPFEQILRNLFSNAIKHHDLDEGVIRLEGRRLNNDFYEFAVIDDGPGIPARFQERIFGMFQTLQPRDQMEGSGIGLALIKKIVDNYGGKISVQSNGRGCRFTFTWPHTLEGKQHHD